MTRIETAALELANFLRRACVPAEAIGTRDAEWPLSIRADDDVTANRLAELLNELQDSLVMAGHMTRI